MNILFSDSSRVLLLIVGCAVLWSLESVIPLYPHGEGRVRRALPNAGLTVLLLLTNLALSFVAAGVAGFAASHRVGLLSLVQLPAWASVITGIAALDLFTYAAHVLLHKTPFAWRFHRVHHSDQAVDVTTAFRQHPGETVWRALWQLPAIVLFGLPLWIEVIYLTVSAANAQIEHANIRLSDRLDRWLRLLIVTPKQRAGRRGQKAEAKHRTVLFCALPSALCPRQHAQGASLPAAARDRLQLREHLLRLGSPVRNLHEPH